MKLISSNTFLIKKLVKIIGSIPFPVKNDSKIIIQVCVLLKKPVQLINLLVFLIKNRLKLIGSVLFLIKMGVKIIILVCVLIKKATLTKSEWLWKNQTLTITINLFYNETSFLFNVA